MYSSYTVDTKYEIICEVYGGVEKAFLGHTDNEDAYPTGELKWINLDDDYELPHDEDLAFRTYVI